VADWHALTSEYAATDDIAGYAYSNVADWIAAGLDPAKSTIFVQSLVPEHAELHLLLSMIIPVPWLERVPTYKELQEQLSRRTCRRTASWGTAPADGGHRDVQRPLRAGGRGPGAAPRAVAEVVRRFHKFYGEVFVEPQPLLTRFPRLPGLDNRKMSKSYGNASTWADDAATSGRR